MRRFVTLFAVFALSAYALTRTPFVQEHVSAYLNIAVSHTAGFLIMLTGMNVNVVGEYVTVPGFSLRIVDMCNGLEPTVLLWAAVIAYPTSWAHRLKGMLLGYGVIFFENLVRVCSLLLLSTYDRYWVDWAHWYLFDTLMVITIVLVFLAWTWMPAAGIQDERKEV